MTHRVVFTPSGLAGDVESGTNVLDAARRLGVDLDTVCGGRGVCGRCQVVLTTGTLAKWQITSTADSLSPPGDAERGYRGARPLAPGHRLGCAARIHGDAVIDVPAASQVHRQVVRKDLRLLDLPPITVDPLFTRYYLELPPAAGGSVAGALLDALHHQHAVTARGVTPAVLRAVHTAAAGGAVTAAVADGEVVAVWPGYAERILGAAIDVGSTTMAAHLCDLSSGEVLASAGRMNPQIRYGEDLMSRVSYAMMNPGGAAELTEAVRAALGELIAGLLADVGAGPSELLEVGIVGNPIMHHLVLGIDPTPLGQAPFPLATDAPVTGPAPDVGIAAPFARYYAGPCIAGHVGADTAAAVLAEGPHRGEALQLLVDIGTNAEIVLGDRTRQYAASSPTGPAFEGAQLSAGQRATAGAIEAVRIDPGTLEPRFRVIGSDRWSDEEGFAGTLPATGVTGICGSGAIDAVAEMYLTGVIDAAGTILGANAARTERVVADGRTFRYVVHRDERGELAITQNDVRAIQLAKAALRAGVELLLDRAGRPAVTDVRLAGAFGAHIDPLHALVLGLVPDCPLDGVRAVGNAAGAGAVAALLSRAARVEMEEAARRIVKVETATEPRFQELFVDAMALPHATAPSDHLGRLVVLPERAAAPGGGARRRRGARMRA